MKKSLHVALDDQEIIELMRILMDECSESTFLALPVGLVSGKRPLTGCTPRRNVPAYEGRKLFWKLCSN
jgi:hypothetical protein